MKQHQANICGLASSCIPAVVRGAALVLQKHFKYSVLLLEALKFAIINENCSVANFKSADDFQVFQSAPNVNCGKFPSDKSSEQRSDSDK